MVPIKDIETTITSKVHVYCLGLKYLLVGLLSGLALSHFVQTFIYEKYKYVITLKKNLSGLWCYSSEFSYSELSNKHGVFREKLSNSNFFTYTDEKKVPTLRFSTI